MVEWFQKQNNRNSIVLMDIKIRNVDGEFSKFSWMIRKLIRSFKVGPNIFFDVKHYSRVFCHLCYRDFDWS